MALTCAQLLDRYPHDWQGATVHPFLSQCKTGTIHPLQFNTWLVQDYQFVLEFTRMAARLLAIAPVSHFDVLLTGLSALQQELTWFQSKAIERQLSLTIPKHPTCSEYCTYMMGLATDPYAVQATAFWAIERAYNEGWQNPGAMTPPYHEFADRWGNAGFSEYVVLLAQQADEALATTTLDVQQQAEQSFLEITRLEREFWQMAFVATAS